MRIDPIAAVTPPRSEKDWHQQLTPEQFHILREKGTERAFTGQYWNVHDDGSYHCAGCGALLFDSGAKFDSGTGWPSFTAPAVADAVALHVDNGFLMRRTEVVCQACGGHLGHVFPDGPNGMPRYCINSASLDLKHRSDTPATTSER
jgi:peptide-methionine (R)-S-oxide reductase